MEGYAGIYAWCEWVKLNICNISIFKTPVGLGLWLSEGSSEQIPESSRCPWLSGFTESGGCWTSLSTAPVSLSLIYFGKASTASSSVTQQEQELDSSLASVSVIFCCIPLLSFFSYKWQISTVEKTKTISTLFNAKYFSQAVPHNMRQKCSLISALNTKTLMKSSEAQGMGRDETQTQVSTSLSIPQTAALLIE